MDKFLSMKIITNTNLYYLQKAVYLSKLPFRLTVLFWPSGAKVRKTILTTLKNNIQVRESFCIHICIRILFILALVQCHSKVIICKLIL